MHGVIATFDPDTLTDGAGPTDGFLQTLSDPTAPLLTTSSYYETVRRPIEEVPYRQNLSHMDGATNGVSASATDRVHQQQEQQLGIHMENSLKNNGIHMDSHLLQEMIHDPNLAIPFEPSSWDPSLNEVQDMGLNAHQNQNHQFEPFDLQSVSQSLNYASSLTDGAPSNAPDLLNILHMPRSSPSSSFLANSSFFLADSTQRNTSHQSSTLGFLGELFPNEPHLCDPLFRFDVPLQPPIFRDLFQSLPHGYSLPDVANDPLYGGEHEAEFDNGVLEFNRDMACIGERREGKVIIKHYTTEKERRVQLNDRYQALRSLVPNPGKDDKASIVMDAINYIRSLHRKVDELKLLVEKKRYGRERRKRHKTEEEEEEEAAGEDMENCKIRSLANPDQPLNGSSRSSWLQRKSKNTQVDVQIIEDDVTIKLVQRKKIDFLLLVSKALDELQLEIHYMIGGHIGDCCSFLFNTKICEGSAVYTSTVANRLIEVMDKHNSALPSTSGQLDQ